VPLVAARTRRNLRQDASRWTIYSASDPGGALAGFDSIAVASDPEGALAGFEAIPLRPFPGGALAGFEAAPSESAVVGNDPSAWSVRGW